MAGGHFPLGTYRARAVTVVATWRQGWGGTDDRGHGSDGHHRPVAGPPARRIRRAGHGRLAERPGCRPPRGRRPPAGRSGRRREPAARGRGRRGPLPPARR
ncbi:hypothetical protein SCOCK_10364 [Actinacidiphila cocklensis]|uniref:Uncharacterized protein n=1 Tax=Actinacidiphila cocklensis TaxID=887465 RepID=A0A9W4GN29_9ACTN|nr:hypothetical protein SCOCK_10364 [Actinacidiphila cocklensis]